jgi:H+/Cl- antiporter ClcA
VSVTRSTIGFLLGFSESSTTFFLGRFFFFYDANTYTPPSPWGLFVILVPVVGALVVTLLVTKFAPEARGHGFLRLWTLSIMPRGEFVLS